MRVGTSPSGRSGQPDGEPERISPPAQGSATRSCAPTILKNLRAASISGPCRPWTNLWAGGPFAVERVFAVGITNTPPTISPLSDQVTDEDADGALSVADDRVAAEPASIQRELLCAWRCSRTGDAVLRAQRALARDPGPTNQTGAATITLTVDDGFGGFSTIRFAVTVSPSTMPLWSSC